MRRIALLLFAATAAAACTAGPAPIVATYNCGGHGTVTASYTPEILSLNVAGRQYRLPRAISGSGARYTDGKTLFWDNGRTAILSVGGGRQASCTVVK